MLLVVLYPPPASNAETAPRLASALGRTEYEARLWLASPLPHIVARVESRGEADACVASLRGWQFDAEWLDDESLPSSADMTLARSPSIDDAGLHANGPGSERLGWDEIVAMVLAKSSIPVERSSVEAVAVRVGRGTVTMPREKTTHERSAQSLLYLFARAGMPWMFAEQGVQWASLGVPLRPTRRENLLMLIDVLRKRAPRAHYDDSLLKHPAPRFDLAQVRAVRR